MHRNRRPARPLTASAVVRGRADSVFAFLADLDNHLLFHDRHIRIVELAGEPGQRHGGRVRLRGPLGLRRFAHTQVTHRQPPHLMTGLARIGERTVAHVRWALHPDGEHTRIELSTTITSAGLVDRALLALGGKLWLRRRICATLATLAATATLTDVAA
ncbi:MAG TPA: SRPBCC family protein [Kribbellaceae bacterium]